MAKPVTGRQVAIGRKPEGRRSRVTTGLARIEVLISGQLLP